MKTRLILALSLAILARAHGSPIVLEMTLDTERHGTATVSGSILDTKFPAADPTKTNWSGGYYFSSKLSFATVGKNWNVWGDITREAYYTAADVFINTVYDLTLFGQHMVAPDPGEAANGLKMLVYDDNLGGSTTANDRSPGIDTWDSYPHVAGTHSDVMSLAVLDLNGKTVPGVFGGFSDNFAATVELYHVPELGSTLLWWGICCAGAAWISRHRCDRR